MLVFGGLDGSREEYAVFNDTHLYNFESKAWTHLKINGELPAGREGHAAWLQGDEMLIYGGTSGEKQPLEDFMSLGLISKKWTKVTV
jgi:N-acetylneuraminic acid mutarotase